MKFDVGSSSNLLMHYNFGSDQTTKMGTLHEGLHEFLHVEVAG
jgi:hypothetical protein